MLDFHNTIFHKLWSVDEALKSSSYRELTAVSLGLESFLPLLKKHIIKWCTDNQSVSFPEAKQMLSSSHGLVAFRVIGGRLTSPVKELTEELTSLIAPAKLGPMLVKYLQNLTAISVIVFPS